MEILKKIVLQLLIVFPLSNLGIAQNSFYHIFSGSGYDKAEGIAQLPDSSYLVTGSSSSFQDAPSQVFLMKLDKNGFHQWSKVYGGAEFETGRRVLSVDNFGNYIVGTSSSNNNAFDGYVVFTDMNGNQIWEKWYDLNGSWERFNDALLLPDTSIILIGETTNNPEQLSDRLLMRIDKDGNILWSNQQATTGNDFLQKGTITSDTTFVLVGTAYNSDSLQNKAYIATFHKNGTLLWDTLIGKNGDYILNDISYVGGNFVAGGQKIQNGKTDYDEYMAFITGSGLVYAEYDYYSQYDNRIVGFVNYTATPGNKFFTGIQTINPNFTYPGGEDFILSRYAAAFYWDGYGVGYSGFGQDQMNHIIQTKDSFAICVGYHSDERFSPGGNSMFVLKVGSDSNFPVFSFTTIYNILSLKEESKESIETKVFPNPCVNQITINTPYSIQEIKVVNVSGIELNVERASTHEINTENWAQGVYFLKIKLNDQWITKKVCKQ